MRKITIISPGKNKETWLQEALNDYSKRLQSHITIEWKIVKTSQEFIQLALKETNAFLLDPDGLQLDSIAFSAYLEKAWEKQGSRLTFLIGGAEGVPDDIKDKFARVSLSSMTFTHQLTRLIFLEQVYRASEIMKGSPYHK